MVLLENIWLLLAGLAIGILAALVTTIPHYIIGGASIPWLDLVVFAGNHFALWSRRRMAGVENHIAVAFD